MKLTAWLFAVLIELTAACGYASAALRPLYGGTLRVHLRARVVDADPSSWPADGWEREAKTRILAQVFEPLVWLDEKAAPHPALAKEWQHDAGFRRWTFALREGVQFHDGTSLTPAVAADSLARVAEGCAASAGAGAVVIRCDRAAPDLPADLALPKNWISRRGDGSAFGTGPFRLQQWEASRMAVLSAFEQHWAGRPFLDGIRFEMGQGGREQVMALELGRADIVELGPADFRRVSQRGAPTWTSPLLEVIGLAAQDEALREALALSIDRAPIHNVLLGRQGEISGAILPQWLSGYAFLFTAGRDLAKARTKAAALRNRQITIGFDPPDPVARSIAERIAVDAREAGIVAQASTAGASDAKVVRLRIASPNPVTALRSLGAQITDASALPYADERRFVDSHHLLPLFHVPDLFALSAQVRAFSWRLAGVWLEPVRP
jgi:ABC-type transport system substrate-binding protein